MNEAGFKDHFSGHAGDYASHRPGYPAALFDWLAAQAPSAGLAWDCGTGNGQVAVDLAERFDAVHATDASAQQIASATPQAGVTYAVEAAERCSLADGATDLVTVGQALHWFDLPRFYPEVRRVLRPDGLFAAWTYQLADIEPSIDAVVLRFFTEVVGPFWPPERVHVEAGYQDLPFPFEELDAPVFTLVTDMRLGQYLDYIGTWSAVHRYRRDRKADPLDWLGPRLKEAWGGDEPVRQVSWPMAIRAGRL